MCKQIRNRSRTVILAAAIAVFALAACVISTQSVSAETVAEGTCGTSASWTLDEKGTLTISGSGAMEDYENFDVTPWYEKNRDSIKKVVVEQGITRIGSHAFEFLGNMTDVKLAESITEIGNKAFLDTGIRKVDLPAGLVKLEDYAFACTEIKTVTLHRKVEDIGLVVFWKCENLETVVIEEGVTAVGEMMFLACANLKNIELPDTITSIGAAAFDGCSSLESITLRCPAPAVITNGIAAISGTVYYPADDESWDEETRIAWAPEATWIQNMDGALVARGECGENATWKLTDEGVLSVRGTGKMTDYSSSTPSPFYEYRQSIKKIVIDKGITSVGAGCFSGRGGTTAIESVELPETITSIGASAFNWCTNLKDIEIPDNVVSIGAYAFYNCDSMTRAILPAGLEEMGEAAFGACDGFETIDIPDALTSLGDCAFANCMNLKSLSLPGNIYYIPGQTVGNCHSLESVRFRSTPPGRYISTAFNTFKGVIYYPENVEFWDEETQTAWAPDAEWVADGKAEIRIVDHGVCGSNAIWTLNNIGMLSVYIEGSGELQDYKSGEDTPWAKYMNEIKGVRFSDGIETVGKYMFYGCALRKVFFPNTLKTVKEYAFEGCLNLKQVKLPSSLRTIEHGAFNNCGVNDALELPEGLIEIGSYAFADCNNIKSITIPSTVLRIGQTAFGSGFGEKAELETVIFRCSAPAVNEGGVFEQFSGTVKYPADDEFWDEAARNVWAPDANWVPEGKLNITEIAAGTCGNGVNWSLDSQGVIHIKGKGKMNDYSGVGVSETNSPWNAYRKCIKKAVIEEGVTNVGACSFRGCEGMLQTEIAKSVTALGDFMLQETPKLKIVRLKCPVPAKASNALLAFTGVVAYPGDNATWTETARKAWAPNATWKDNNTVIYNATGDTEIAGDGKATETTISNEEVQDTIEEIQLVKPDHVLVNAKISGGTGSVKSSTTQIPASIARAAEEAGATFAADTVVGKIELDNASVAGDIPEGADHIELNITDKSGTDNFSLLHDVEFKVVKNGEQTSVKRLSGNARVTLPNPKGIVKEDVIKSQVEDENGSFVEIRTVRGTKTFTTTTKLMGLQSSSVKRNLSNAKILGIASAYTYSGKAKKPKFSVKMKDGTPVYAKYYSVTWKANKKVGTATVKVTAKGSRYCGSKSKTFRINPKKPGKPSAKVGKKQLKVTMKTRVSSTGGTKYQVQYRLASKGKWKTVTTSKKTITIKKLKKGKQYQIRVRAVKGKYKGKYSSITKSKRVK